MLSGPGRVHNRVRVNVVLEASWLVSYSWSQCHVLRKLPIAPGWSLCMSVQLGFVGVRHESQDWSLRVVSLNP